MRSNAMQFNAIVWLQVQARVRLSFLLPVWRQMQPRHWTPSSWHGREARGQLWEIAEVPRDNTEHSLLVWCPTSSALLKKGRRKEKALTKIVQKLEKDYSESDVIYKTGETVFHRDIQTPRRELKIRRAVKYYWLNSRCLDIPMKYCLEWECKFSIETKTKE